jgi:glycosyltransferase involved in cell wall biosynthesis
MLIASRLICLSLDMRIAYLIGSDSWGGLELNQAKNALWMAERGHSVLLIGRPGGKLAAFCKEHTLPFEPHAGHKKYYDFNAGKTLANLLMAHQIEHLIIRDVRDMSVSVIAKRKANKQFQVHYFMEMQLGVSKKNLLHTIRFRGLDTWSCPLLWLKKQVETMTNMPKDRIFYIPSALDMRPFNSTQSKADARRLLDLPNDKIILGLAGRFDPQKGQLLLLEALQQIPNNRVSVLFLGEPTRNEGDEYLASMNACIETYQLQERVFIRPFRPDISVFYKAIDAFIMASKAETVGMVTIEAMASGCPVIGSNAGGTSEILQQGKSGYLFEPLNAQSLAEQISRFLENPQLFNADELRQAIAHFDHERVLTEVERVIDRLPN